MTPEAEWLAKTLKTSLEERDVRSAAALERLESLFDASYATAARDRAALVRLRALLEDHGSAPVAAAWLALVRLALGVPSQDAALPIGVRVPPWTRFLVGLEAARIAWDQGGAANAWSRLGPLQALDALEAIFPPTGVRVDSPLLQASLVTLLQLAALNGAWDVHARVTQLVESVWAPESPFRLRVAIAIADAAILRGRYMEALRTARAVMAAAAGDVRRLALATRLHALVALGLAGPTQAQDTLAHFSDDEEPAVLAPGWALPPEDVGRARDRVARLAASPEPARQLPVPPATDGESSDFARRVSALFDDERRARAINQRSRRVPALLAVFHAAQAVLDDARLWSDRLTAVRVRLLWCHVVIDLGSAEVFEGCRRILDDVVRETRELQYPPFEMHALEQRSALCALAGDWRSAALDASEASRIAISLLAANAGGGDDEEGAERSLLESLLPVFDRATQNYADGAVRIAAAHPELLASPTEGSGDVALAKEGPRGAFLRFGRLLQGYAEREQGLALAEVRRAHDDGVLEPARFLAVEGSPLVLDQLRAGLRPSDAVLQYFIIGPYLMTFVYGRAFFDWCIRVVDIERDAEQAIEALVHSLRNWTQAQDDTDPAGDLQRLVQLVLPTNIESLLQRSRAQYLRIVPHGALYRIPFGRLPTSTGSLLERFSLSLHPTAELAVKSGQGDHPRPSGSIRLGYVAGPDGPELLGREPTPVACAAPEEAALRRGVGRFASIARVVRVDAARLPLETVLTEIAAFTLLHFTCHGREGELRQPPRMRLGREGSAGLDSPRIGGLELSGCNLVFLQSCFTGWMNHRRARPVQGIPQAFLDAGVGAVIAPLTMVPMALAAPFSAVFYRALRFLPAEAALRRALSIMRSYGPAVVRGQLDAKAELAQHGGNMDAFDYRYTGATGLVVGSLLGRLVGRLSFAWFEWALARGMRHQSPHMTSKEKEPCSMPSS